MKKIVCFGGGSAVPELLLKPLKEKRVEIVGITSMVDNGGSTGALRKELGVLPPGDIRRHLIALADLPPGEKWKERLWNFRFARNIELSPGHFGHNFANVFIAGLEKNYGFEKTLEIIHSFLKVKGRALPATLDNVQLIAELENGELVKGEDEIDVGENHNRSLKIKRVYLSPEGKAYQGAIEEVKGADFIIIGPGDLYSSLIPCFLPIGMKEAIMSSPAKKIFICPARTKLGETQNYTIKEFAGEIENYLDSALDFVIYNNNIPGKGGIKAYKEKIKEKFLLDPPRIDKGLNGDKFIGTDLLSDGEEIKYNKEKVIQALKKIINF